ncbi:MAG: 4-(cytidine 5'-diphospho)-2-C-methyl-D-erythritol kinase [Thermoguttaceae bacterium]
MYMEVAPDGASYRVWAPAKVNLFFEIMGKRLDGYHDVETLVAPISLYDRLEFSFAPTEGEDAISLECLDEEGKPRIDLPNDSSNLVVKAYYAYLAACDKEKRARRHSRVCAKILKKIPTKAGLGGGSSDAMATLLVLNAYDGANFSKEELARMAGEIGSDAPLFLEESATIGRGRGEIVEPFPLGEIWMTLVKPTIGFSTPEVYRKYAESPLHSVRHSLSEALDSLRETNTAENLSRWIWNRLEEPVAALWDEFPKWKSSLGQTSGALGAQMSGSGSSFFVLTRDEESAHKVAQEVLLLSNSLEIDFVYVVKTLTPDNNARLSNFI